MKPRVELIALGGTIASRPRPGASGVFPGMTADDLVRAVPGVGALAETLGANPSPRSRASRSAFLCSWSLAALIAELEAAGAHGIVVTQGTDTIEETSYVLGSFPRRTLPGHRRGRDA